MQPSERLCYQFYWILSWRQSGCHGFSDWGQT